MGDKSPKSTNKQANQKQTKADATKGKKQAPAPASPPPGKK